MNRSRRPRSRAASACLALVAAGLISLGAPMAARAQVMQQVPSDALVVIKVNNLKAVSDKVAKFAEALGLAAVSPEFANPLQSLQDNMKIKQGLDTSGEMAFVFTKAAAKGGNPDEGMMILMPVSDYKAFLGNFQDVKTDGAVSTFKPHEGNDKEIHAVNWGKYAAVSENQALLAQKPAGLKLSGLADKEAKEKDAFIFANIPALAEIALPHIQEARDKAMGEIDKELGNNDEAKEFTGVAKAAFGQALNVAEGFLKTSTGASLSLHLNDHGLSTTMMADFKPGSYAANMITKLKPTEQPLMAGLPNRKFFVAGGIVNEPQVSGPMIGDLFDPVSKELSNTKAGKGFASAIDAFKKSAGATKSVAFGYTVPTGALGADSIFQSVMVAKGDSAIIHSAQKEMLQGTAELMKLIPQQPGAPKVSYEVTPGAKSVGDVKLDSYAFNMQMDENNPQAAQAQQMMAFIYGPNGLGGSFGPVSKDTYVMVQGGTDKLLQDVVSSAKNNGPDAISSLAGVKKVSGQLPGKRLMTEYIFLDNILNSAVRYAQGFGMQVKMQLPADLPPIGVTAASEGTAFRIDSFVPTQLVQSVVAAGMQTFMQMQGGGGAGQPDGL